MWWNECNVIHIKGRICVNGETHRQWARHGENFINDINDECTVTSVCVCALPPISVPVIHLHFDCSVKHIKREEKVFV